MSDQQLGFSGASPTDGAERDGNRTPARDKHLIGLVLFALIVVAAPLAGCGSSKPAYCSKVTDLKKSVQDAAKLETVKKGPSAVSSAVAAINSAAHAVVSATKSDFPSETSAITSAVDGLSKSARQLSTSPAATAAALPVQIAAANTAVKNLVDATSTKCG